ncbi:MAG: hypothetical protein WCJ35_28405 [Planctomycetota bacterium]
MSHQTEVKYDDLEYTPEGLFLLDGQPYSGTALNRDSEGRKVSEVPFLNGREHGVARSWYANGQLAEETPYLDGTMHGIRREMFEDGSLQSEEVIEFGTLMRKAVHDHKGQLVDHYERQPSDPLYQNVLQRRSQL